MPTQLARRPFRLALLACLALPLAACSYGSAAGNQERVLRQLDAMKDVLVAEELSADDVSAWSTWDQSEHVLRANEAIAGVIAADAEPETIEPTTFAGKWVLWWRSIPRGQGQAPEMTVPADLGRVELLALHARVEEAVRALDLEAIEDGDRVVGNHPVFGGYTAAQWLRLMDVHGEHHADIVTDIQEAATAGE